MRSLPKKLEDALLACKSYCVAAKGAPVSEDIGGVGTYCDFYFDPKSTKVKRFLACEMGRTGRMAIRSACSKMETTFPEFTGKLW